MRPPDKLPMISTYPADKIKVGCKRCERTAQYDVRAMLVAGGDRSLLDLLDAIKKRLGCEHLEQTADIYNRCRLCYVNLAREPSEYEKARRG